MSELGVCLAQLKMDVKKYCDIDSQRFQDQNVNTVWWHWNSSLGLVQLSMPSLPDRPHLFRQFSNNSFLQYDMTLLTLKRQCHDNRWFLAAILCGKNNGGHKARPQKTTISRGKMTFARFSWGGEAARAADRAVMVQCPRHLREQSPFFARAKKAQEITEYRDTAPLINIKLLHWQASRWEKTSEKALTDTSKFVFGLTFRPLSQGLSQRIWEAIWGCHAT